MSSARTDPVDHAIDVTTVFRRHHAFVWRSLRIMGLSESASDDALQEVFMVVHRRLPDYDRQRDMRGWLYGIAKMMVRRSQARAARDRQQEARLRAVTDTIPSEQTAVDPVGQLERAQALARVNRFLDQLEPEQREVFGLVDIEGFSGPEAAKMLGLKLNTVYSRLRLARARFESFLRREHATLVREVKRGA